MCRCSVNYNCNKIFQPRGGDGWIALQFLNICELNYPIKKTHCLILAYL